MTNEAKYWYLRNFELCQSLSKKDVYLLAEQARCVRLKKNDAFYLSRRAYGKVVLLISGRVKIMEYPDGRDSNFKSLHKSGELIGADNLYDADNTDQILVALTGGELLMVFENTLFEQMIEQIPVLSIAISKLLSTKLRLLRGKQARMATKSVRERLLDFLNDWALKDGEVTEEGTTITNYLTHCEIGQIINASRQTVTSTISDLRNQGTIEFDRSHIFLPSLTYS